MVSAQSNKDSLRSVVRISNNIEETVDASLQYAELILDSSFSSAMEAVEHVIEESQKEQYQIGVVKGELLKSWFLLMKVDYENALKSAHQAMTILQNEQLDSLEMSRTLNLLGLIHLEFDQLDKAMDYLRQALHWLQLIGDSTRIDRAYNNLGALSKKKGQFALAINYFRQSRALRVQLEDSNRIAYSDFNLGSTYLKWGKLDSAGFYLSRSIHIFNRKGSAGGVPDMVHIELGEYYLAVGSFQKAIASIQKGLNEALENGYADRWKSGYDLLAEALYESGKNKLAYETLKQRIAFTDSLNQATNASAMAEMEERYQSAETEKKLMRSVAENLEKESQIMRMRFQNIGLLTSAFLLILVMILLFWYRSQKRKIVQADLQTALASSKLMALRSQMNSHFIFNSINTLQGFVTSAQREKTYSYLDKFARLLRAVLENASEDFVPLENEIELLKNYIDIEAMRFNNKFSYDLQLEAVLEHEIFEIPSMIIQPFVENAINHGLINLKERNGLLKIKLSKKAQQILCEVEDNGVGRRRAEEIKKRKERYYKSKAFSNVKERLNLFVKEGEAKVHFQITDLYNEQGETLGTKVEIWMPYR